MKLPMATAFSGSRASTTQPTLVRSVVGSARFWIRASTSLSSRSGRHSRTSRGAVFTLIIPVRVVWVLVVRRSAMGMNSSGVSSLLT